MKTIEENEAYRHAILTTADKARQAVMPPTPRVEMAAPLRKVKHRMFVTPDPTYS